MTTRKLPKAMKFVIIRLSLAGAPASAFLPLQRLGQQFAVLIVLIWSQVFFITEVFLAGK